MYILECIIAITIIVGTIALIIAFLGWLWDLFSNMEDYGNYKCHCKNDGALPISFEQFKSLYAVAPKKWGVNQDLNGEVHYFYAEDSYGEIHFYAKNSHRTLSSKKSQAFYFKTLKDWKEYKKWFANLEKRKAEETNIMKMEEMLEYWKKDVEEWKEQGDTMISSATETAKKYL